MGHFQSQPAHGSSQEHRNIEPLILCICVHMSLQSVLGRLAIFEKVEIKAFFEKYRINIGEGVDKKLFIIFEWPKTDFV